MESHSREPSHAPPPYSPSASPQPATPPALLHPGLLSGHPLALDPMSMRPLAETELSTKITAIRLKKGWEHVSWRGGERGVVCLKSVEDEERGERRAPRKLRIEVEVLGALNHPNILGLLNAYLIPPRPPQDWTFLLHTPLYPLSLSSLLQHPASTFESPPNSSEASSPSPLSPFARLVPALAHQLLSAVAYLHRKQIVHRDLNPSNIVLSRQGRLVIIDFGLALGADGADDVSGRRECQVGTGPYRAPELLFGSTDYAMRAIDLWSVGCILAECFRPLAHPAPPSTTYRSVQPSGRVHALDSDDSDGSADEWISRLEPGRKPLFDAGVEAAVDLAAIGAVFKVVGTPTVEIWPEAKTLPSFSSFSFVSFERQPLEQLCPALASFPTIHSIVERLLVCSAAQRMSALDALRLFEQKEEGATLKVTGEEPDWDGGSFGCATLEGKSLGQWLAPFV